VFGLLLIGSAVATALFAADAARLPSLVSTLLVAYLAFVTNLGLTTLVLSPFEAATRTGLGAAEAVLLSAAVAAWWLRGRPQVPLAQAGAALRAVLRDPVTAVFLAVVIVLLGYELVLAVTVPPNNGDALGYHLPRAAAWAQHGGVYWIDDAPTVRMNVFQPLAEQQIMFLLVATRSLAVIALPQYLAQLAILLAVYGSSRRLGFGVRAAACAAFLLATFPLPALEATTAQNDLVAASFPAVAACLLLGGGALEAALGGAAAGMGVGVKLTTALVVPVLAWVAFARGRRTSAAALAGGVAGFVALGVWGFVLNASQTGHIFGSGTATVMDRGSPSYPGSVANAFYLLYGLMDLSVLSNRLIDVLAIVGVVVALGVAASRLRSTRARPAVSNAAAVALPFLAPLLVVGAAATLAAVARLWGFPIRGTDGVLWQLEQGLNKTYTRISNEDYSAFGPVGIVALAAATALTGRAFLARRADTRHLALACALPLFLVLLSLGASWNAFLIRFFTVSIVLAAPLLARLFTRRLATAAYLVVAAIVAGVTIVRVQTKPLDDPYGFGAPWHLTQIEALDTNSRREWDGSLPAFERLVPAHGCVGAVVGDFEPSFLLFGPKLQRRVIYLSPEDALADAVRKGAFRVLLSDVREGASQARAAFAAAGWHVRSLGGFWYLATDRHAPPSGCAP
jgi:hypothetical protein